MDKGSFFLYNRKQFNYEKESPMNDTSQVRLLENAEDLIADIAQAIEKV